jgi:thiamine pyridinylase
VPNFLSVKSWVVAEFQKKHPDIQLEIIDLTSNYYGSFVEGYVGCSQSDVYELDSVFLRDFAINGKIQVLPDGAKESTDLFLKNAVAGVQVDGVQYGAPHWVCGNFLFFQAADKAMKGLSTLDMLKAAIGPHPGAGGGIAVDLKGKSTLGEFYLNAAVDRYPDWKTVKEHIGIFDLDLEKDLAAIRDMCEGSSCRDSKKHSTPFFAEEFGAKKARALIGYSESLNGMLNLAADKSKCPDRNSCLQDRDIDVEELPLDPAANKAMSWVDSFTVDANCKDQCAADAAAFIHFMNEDDTYIAILVGANGVPTYLLPAKASLYSNSALLKKAHLYPALRSIIEKSIVPSDLGLNEELRNTGRVVDSELSKP